MIKSEKTRKFIIKKVAPVFNIKGFTGTYLTDLTEVTGLSKGSIYGNFKDKNEVALEAFRYNFRQLSKKVVSKISKLERADEKLKEFLNFYKQEHLNIIHTGGCPILNTATDADDGNEFLKIEVTKSINSWIGLIENIVKEGILKFEIKKINPYNFAVKMVSIVEGSIMLAKILNSPDIILSNIETLENEINQITNK